MINNSKLNGILLQVCILIAAACFIYSEISNHQFITTWDDPSYILNNGAIRAFSPDNVKTVFSRLYVGNYAPIHILSYMVDYKLWGLQPFGYLLSNVILHLLNALLFYFLLLRLNYSKLVGGLASFIFLSHPVQVESVAWASQRKTLLAMLFFLLSWHAYVKYREMPWKTGGWRYYSCALAAFSAAVLSKVVAVILPPFLLLFERSFPREKRQPLWLAHLPFWAIAVFISILTIAIQDPGVYGGRRGHYGGTLLGTVLTMLPVHVRYVTHLLWPAGLTVEYVFPIKTHLDGEVIGAAILLSALFWGIFLLYRRNSPLFCWAMVFVLGIAPVSGVVPLVTQMNDRYLYFPLLGAAVCFSVALAHAYELIRHKTAARSLGIFVLLPLLALPLLSRGQVRIWEDSITLWSDCVRKSPQNAFCYAQLGDAYYQRGWQDKATQNYQEALRIIPDHPEALRGLGFLYLNSGDFLKSRQYLTTLSSLYPGDRNGWLLLAKNYLASGYPEKAVEAVENVLHMKPDDKEALQLKLIAAEKIHR